MSYNAANPFGYLMSGANRTYNLLPSNNHAAFNFAFNPYYDNGNGVTGQHQLITTDAQGALRVGGESLSAVTGQLAQLQATVNTMTGAAQPWKKAKSAGYVSGLSPVASPCLVNKVQGFTKTNTQPSFIMIFDSAVFPAVGSNPDFVVSVQANNNFFMDMSDVGVTFTNGLTIVNSSTPDVYNPVGASDFIVSAIYK